MRRQHSFGESCEGEQRASVIDGSHANARNARGFEEDWCCVFRLEKPIYWVSLAFSKATTTNDPNPYRLPIQKIPFFLLLVQCNAIDTPMNCKTFRRRQSIITSVMGMPRCGLIRAVVLRAAVVVHGASTLFLWQKLFDFPIALLDAHAELEIFFRDRIPVLDGCQSIHIEKRVVALTLYTIMTANKLQMVAKNRPSR